MQEQPQGIRGRSYTRASTCTGGNTDPGRHCRPERGGTELNPSPWYSQGPGSCPAVSDNTCTPVGLGKRAQPGPDRGWALREVFNPGGSKKKPERSPHERGKGPADRSPANRDWDCGCPGASSPTVPHTAQESRGALGTQSPDLTLRSHRPKKHLPRALGLGFPASRRVWLTHQGCLQQADGSLLLLHFQLQPHDGACDFRGNSRRLLQVSQLLFQEETLPQRKR